MAVTRRGVQRTTAQINQSSSTRNGDVQPPLSQFASMPSSLGDAEGDKDNTNSQAGNTKKSSSTSNGDVQPPPSQHTSMPSSLGDAEGVNENAITQAGSNVRKKGRGRSCGKNILKAIAKNDGKKLRILFPEHLARPVENAHLLASGIGIIIRYHAPLINVKSFDDMLSQDKEKLYEGLKAWFEFVDIETDPLVQHKLDEMLKVAFRHWKSKMHVAYTEKIEAGRNPIEDCPFDWLEEEAWKAMCESFEEPKFKRRSDVNKNNRRKQQYPHSSGSQAFHVRYYRKAEAERSLVKNWRDCHTRKNGRMVNEKAELLAEVMDTKKSQLSDAGDPVMEEDILAETLERKTPYRKGMGHGFMRSIPKKHIHIHNSEALKNAREQLREQESQLARQQTQIENQQSAIEQQNAKTEEQIDMIVETYNEVITLSAEADTLHSKLLTLKENQMKVEASMKKMLAVFAVNN